MAIENFESLAHYILDKIAPGNPSLQKSFYNNLDKLSQGPFIELYLTDEEGNPYFIVGASEIGVDVIA